MKTISIVITAYNYARFLDECIQSVLNQSHKADEVIVVDDESTDNTKEVVAKYPEVKYIWQKNKGLSGARNTGIKSATSNFIGCLDADDIMRPDCIKEHLAIIDDNSVAQCGLMEFGESKSGTLPERFQTYRPQGATLESLLRTNTVYCNAMFPKKAWEAVGGYDESATMRLGLEDWEFWVRVAGAGYQFKTSNYIGLRYRKHGNNMTKATTHPNWKKITEYMFEKNKWLLSRLPNTHKDTK